MLWFLLACNESENAKSEVKYFFRSSSTLRYRMWPNTKYNLLLTTSINSWQKRHNNISRQRYYLTSLLHVPYLYKLYLSINMLHY